MKADAIQKADSSKWFCYNLLIALFVLAMVACCSALISLLFYGNAAVLYSPLHWGVIAVVLRNTAICALVIIAYSMAKIATINGMEYKTLYYSIKSYFICIGVAALFGLVFAQGMGTHMEDSDPVSGGGELVVDYIPTKHERTEHGLLVFYCICFPGILGVFDGLSRKVKK